LNIDLVKNSLDKLLPTEIIDAAQKRGHELYAVGGCVRDSLLGREVGDIDLAVVGDAPKLATDAARSLNAGKVAIYSRFGTALVTTDNCSFEFATARAESYLPDSRKPSEVTPAPIEQDLKRRDFTINALAYGITGPRSGELIDLFDGIDDLSKKSIRTPQNPGDTFSDDPLRMMRAIRFAAELGFKIERRTYQGIVTNVKRLSIVAKERIGDEFMKMLAGSDPVRAMKLLIDCGIMDLILPDVTAMAGVDQVGRHHHKDVLNHSLKVMQNVADRSDDPILRLSGLLHDIGKPTTKKFDKINGWTFHGHEVVGARMTGKIAGRLRIGKKQAQRLTSLVQLHMRPVNLTSEGVTDSAIRRLMVEAGDYLDDQLVLCRADITTANPKRVVRYLKNFGEMETHMADVKARDKMRKFQSPIRGDEIMKLCNIEPGPAIGVLKGRIEDAILDGEIGNDAESAREYLLKIKDEVLAIDPAQLNREQRTRSHNRNRITNSFEFPSQ